MEGKLKKAIMVIIVLLVLIPCSFLLYDSLTDSGEAVELYYMTTDGTMKPTEKEIAQQNREDTLLTTLHTLQNGPKTEGAIACMPTDIQIKQVALVNDVAIVDVSSAYHKMKDTEEVICRSAIVWTLTSLDFVKGVSLTVDGVPLRSNSGKEYGVMDRNKVIINGEISAETTEYAILSLYFANSTRTDLATEERVVEVNANQAREKTIVEQLIEGPRMEGLQRTLPAETKLRDVTTTSDGTCYVDLSQDFVTKHTGGAMDEVLTVYSIVNSLCELEHIKKVQFLVGGEKLENYKGSLEFKTPFTAVSSLKTVMVDEAVKVEK